MKNADKAVTIQHELIINHQLYDEITAGLTSRPQKRAAVSTYFGINVLRVANEFMSDFNVSIFYEEFSPDIKGEYLLISTDGYSLNDYTFYDSLDEAQTAMKKAYSALTPDLWVEEFRDDSYCDDTDAILYQNGENVYVWTIIKTTKERTS